MSEPTPLHFIGSLKTWFVTERSVASSCRAFRSHIHEFSELSTNFYWKNATPSRYRERDSISPIGLLFPASTHRHRHDPPGHIPRVEIGRERNPRVGPSMRHALLQVLTLASYRHQGRGAVWPPKRKEKSVGHVKDGEGRNEEK